MGFAGIAVHLAVSKQGRFVGWSETNARVTVCSTDRITTAKWLLLALSSARNYRRTMSQMEQAMHQDLSERIRERAYEIWIASGGRDGEADQHWLAAEQEILSSQRSAAVPRATAKRIRGRTTVR